MFILSLLTSPLTISLLITILTTFPLPLILNYIYKNIPKYFFQLVGFTIFIYISFIGFIISIYSSYMNCNHTRGWISFKKGLYQGFISLIVYLIIFMIPFFKSGFIDIGENNIFWNSIAEGFFIGMINMILTIDNFFTSQKDGCQLDPKQAHIAYKKYERKLNNRKKKKTKKKVTITN